MSTDAIITLAIILIAFVLFSWERFSVDHIALGITASLILSGVLTPEEGIKGFANPAVITVAAMFVLSDALLRTGLFDRLGPWLQKLLTKDYRLALFGLMGGTGLVSGFINNTPVVSSLIPVIRRATHRSEMHASRLLIPLSYAAILGGSCTLIGTSTNLLISGIAGKYGIDNIRLFTFTPLGLVFFTVGMTYLLLVSKRLLPAKGSGLDESEISIKDYVTELTVLPHEPENLEDRLTVQRIFKQDGLELKVLRILRKGRVIEAPGNDFELIEGDVLIARGEREKIRAILKNQALFISEREEQSSFTQEETKLVEIVLLPTSPLVDKRLRETDFLDRFRAVLLAIRQRGGSRLTKLDRIKLKAGDVLFLQTNPLGHKLLLKAEREQPTPFLSLTTSEVTSISPWKLPVVLTLLSAVILLSALDILDIMTGSLAAIVTLIFLGISRMENAYNAIDWKVIILLGGALSMGEALEQSGLSSIIADLLREYVGERYGVITVISILYLGTSVLTEVMSNNAAAALLAPIAISLAAGFGCDPLPLLMSIAFAASASFMTPIGYQTNTMVYSAGNYNFKDFLRIGTPLNILLWILATWLIPIFYPL